MSTAASYADLLSRCVLFEPLTAEDKQKLASRAVLRRYRAGQAVFRVGDPGDSLMAVASGIVRISMAGTNGRQIILSDLPAGEVFGEVALLDGLGRSADATALEATELLIIERGAFIRFLAEHPEASLRMLALVCNRLRTSDERMSDIASVELGVRLAKALVRRAPTGDETQPRISLTQGDLASMISSSREAVNRQLANWQRSGLVEVLDGVIVVHRPSDLAIIAGLV
jgi:CRP-like cAMP-binding protein